MEVKSCFWCQGSGLLESDEECSCVNNECQCQGCKTRVIHNVYPQGREVPKDMMNPNIGGHLSNKTLIELNKLYEQIAKFDQEIDELNALGMKMLVLDLIRDRIKTLSDIPPQF
jgi:hypothetical protein